MDVTRDTLDHVFKYHRPTEGQANRYEQINLAMKSVAENVLLNCPPSRERSLALTAIQEARMWANAAIAINSEPPGMSPMGMSIDANQQAEDPRRRQRDF